MYDTMFSARAGETFAFSPENPSGAKGGGSRGLPNEKLNPNIRIQPGETITLVDTDGPGILRSIWMGGYGGWHLILRIYWDGQSQPSVEAPVCAFFGCPFYENIADTEGRYVYLNSAMLMVAPARGLNSYWPMPFRRHCRVTLENRHPSEAQYTYYCFTGEHAPVAEDALYFCASYRQALPNLPGVPYTILDGVEGQGHFAGVTLGASLNGANNCWVEGEAKMYLDGDVYPSVNYTGTEDYFCGSYAFGNDMSLARYQPYSGLYAGMYAVLGGRRDQPYNTQSRYMAYRLHVPDPILFSHDFRMTLQNIHYQPGYGAQSRRDDYVSVAYWYQTLPNAPLAPLPADRELELY